LNRQQTTKDTKGMKMYGFSDMFSYTFLKNRVGSVIRVLFGSHSALL